MREADPSRITVDPKRAACDQVARDRAVNVLHPNISRIVNRAARRGDGSDDVSCDGDGRRRRCIQGVADEDTRTIFIVYAVVFDGDDLGGRGHWVLGRDAEAASRTRLLPGRKPLKRAGSAGGIYDSGDSVVRIAPKIRVSAVHCKVTKVDRAGRTHTL